MIPQGTSLINTDSFVNTIDSINACEECAQLQALVNDAFASINAIKSNMQAELDKLLPVLSLTNPPGANLGSIVTWITSFIDTTLTPLVKPTITYAAQLTATLDQIANVTSAVNAAAGRLTSCTITIPT